MTGTVVGYDPGGNGKHGLAWATVEDGHVVSVATHTHTSAEDVVRSILGSERPLVGLGVDTLTCWSTSAGGWRPADRWLRGFYRHVRNAIVAPNALFGAMSVNGMAVLMAVRQAFPDIFVTETHPKILYYSQFNEPYDYDGPNASVMDGHLSHLLGVCVATRDEHQWDAAISVLPVVRGRRGSWQDLHARPTHPNERLVHPCGKTVYMWPENERRSGLPAKAPQARGT